MSEVEITQVNPMQQEQPPVEEVAVSKEEAKEEVNPLMEWVKKQSKPVEAKEEVVEELEEEPAEESGDVEDSEPEKEEVEEEESKEDELLSKRFAELSKREYAAVEREKKIKEQEEKFKQLAERVDELKRSPKQLLEEVGMGFDDFASAYLDELDGKEVKVSAEDRIAEIEAKHNEKWERFEKEQAEREAARIEKAVAQYKESLREDLSQGENAEKFELVNLKGAYDVVYGVIEQHYNKTEEETGEGEMLSIEEAAQMVEDHLEKEAKTFLAAKKLAAKQEEKKKSVTLSNTSAGGAVITDKAQDLSNLSATEMSKKKAAALLKWT